MGRWALILILFTLPSQGNFRKSQCKVDSDCGRMGIAYKCGPRTYKCGKRCEAIQMVCYLPKEPEPAKKPMVPVEPINPYKPVQ